MPTTFASSPFFAPASPDRRRVALWVALFCLAQVVVWSAAYALTYRAPEIDSAEQFVWSFALQGGYWKHPPLPTWIMHGLVALFGTSLVLPFAAAQASVAIALALTWRLGCEFMSPQRSFLALALTSLVTYHNVGADNFNHSTVLLPFQAAALLAFFRATREGRWTQWALTGVFAGLSMLVKYTALFPLAGMLLYFLLDWQLHRRRQFLGLALAAALVALILAPHALWLQTTNFLPFHYARSVTQPLAGVGATVAAVGDFALTQALRLIPFALGLWFVLGLRPARVAEPSRGTATAPRDLLFLWVAGLSPLLLTAFFGLLSGSALQSRWGSNGFLLVGWLALAALARFHQPHQLGRGIRAALAGQLVLCLGMTLSKTVLAEQLQIRTRANFPGAVLARLAETTWRAHGHGPLRLVVSDIWLGGNIVAHSSQRVAVLIEGHEFKTPWVREEAVARCGALVLDDQTADKAHRNLPNPALDALMARATQTGTWTLPWANGVGPDKLPTSSGKVLWGVIPPAPGATCDL